MTELVRDTQSDASQDPLDPAVLQAIRPSATRMAAAEDAFVQLLSEEIGTAVRQLPDRGWQLCERIAGTILRLVLSDQPAEAAIQSLHRLGEANQADGFPASEYVTVSHALVRIAREMSGPKWTTTTGSAWIRFFMWLQPYLQAGAGQQVVHRQAAPQQAADDLEAAFRAAFAPAIPPAPTDIGAIALRSLPGDEGGPARDRARDEAVPGLTARDK